MSYSDAQKLRCLERELAFRNRVFPRRIAAGKMTEVQAIREIECMEDIAADYVARLREEERRPPTGQDAVDWKNDHARDLRKHD